MAQSNELVSLATLAATDSGSFHVTDDELYNLSRERLGEIGQLFDQLMKDNPDYEFRISDGFGPGKTIYWRKCSRYASEKDS